jgi:hypothetical protein
MLRTKKAHLTLLRQTILLNYLAWLYKFNMNKYNCLDRLIFRTAMFWCDVVVSSATTFLVV